MVTEERGFVQLGIKDDQTTRLNPQSPGTTVCLLGSSRLCVVRPD